MPPPGPPQYLPEDILLQILPHLPIKSIVRFRCVCKQWHRLLFNNPEFIALFHKHHRDDRRHMYLLKSEERLSSPFALRRATPTETQAIPFFPMNTTPTTSVRHVLELVSYEDGVGVHVETPMPRVEAVMSSVYNEVNVDLDIIGSIDGIFCFAFNRGTSVVLWNPATRDSCQLPDPLLSNNGLWRTSFGFACDYEGSQGCGVYKVVRVVYGQTTYPHDHPYDPREVKAELYDSKSNSWNEIANPPRLNFSTPRCGVIVEGVPYWPADHNVCAESYVEKITIFDPSFDVFRTFKRPDFGPDPRFTWRLGEVNGSLLVLMQKLHKRSVDVWMIEDYSLDDVKWTYRYTVETKEGTLRLNCWKDYEVLLSVCICCEQGKEPKPLNKRLFQVDVLNFHNFI